MNKRRVREGNQLSFIIRLLIAISIKKTTTKNFTYQMLLIKCHASKLLSKVVGFGVGMYMFEAVKHILSFFRKLSDAFDMSSGIKQVLQHLLYFS